MLNIYDNSHSHTKYSNLSYELVVLHIVYIEPYKYSVYIYQYIYWLSCSMDWSLKSHSIVAPRYPSVHSRENITSHLQVAKHH